MHSDVIGIVESIAGAYYQKIYLFSSTEKIRASQCFAGLADLNIICSCTFARPVSKVKYFSLNQFEFSGHVPASLKNVFLLEGMENDQISI